MIALRRSARVLYAAAWRRLRGTACAQQKSPWPKKHMRLASMLVRDIMTTCVVTLREHQSLRLASALAFACGEDHLPVVDEEGRFKGLVNHRDLTWQRSAARRSQKIGVARSLGYPCARCSPPARRPWIPIAAWKAPWILSQSDLTHSLHVPRLRDIDGERVRLLQRPIAKVMSRGAMCHLVAVGQFLPDWASAMQGEDRRLWLGDRTMHRVSPTPDAGTVVASVRGMLVGCM